MIEVLVTGAAGKMGSLSAATIAAQKDMRVVALVDPRGGAEVGDAPCFKALDEALTLTSPSAALDFTAPGAVFANVKALLEAGVPTVVGTTGLRDEQVDVLRQAAAASGVGLVIVPNFALGAVLAMRFAAEAAKYYQHAEVIEMHGAAKLDAPSGTSLRSAHLMGTAEGSSLQPPPSVGPPSRGLSADNVTIHSVRLPGLVAHQEVLFGGDDELLTIRHDSFSRRSFMSGVLLALRGVGDLKETVVGLENLLT
jgi:4-hydroxy-tetrahydrodipicolinate reductase